MLNFAKPTKSLPTNGEVRVWLESQMKEHDLPTLLAFADDGVIWGHWDGNALTISQDLDDSYPELKEKTLQQAFAFGKDIEVRLFRNELGEWKAWQIKDDGEFITESQILWGDKPHEDQPNHDVFQRLLAERKGIPPQLIPIKGNVDPASCIRLEVHHLVDFTADGEAFIAISRLAGLSIDEKAKEV